MLLTGQKCLVIPSSTVENKLTRKYSHKARRPSEGEAPNLYREEVVGVSEDCLKDCYKFCKGLICLQRDMVGWLWKKRQLEKKQFVPPILTPKPWKGSRWEPNLIPIKEISP